MVDSLCKRWETPDGRVLAEEVLARLIAGRALDDLGLGQVGGRLDLRGFLAPVPRRLARFEHDGWFIERLGNLVKLRGVTFRRLDLSGAFLDSFRFWDCQIEDCILEKARCQGWRMWTSQIRGTSFRKADLRQTVLGSWAQGRGNRFFEVNFTQADLRDTPSITAHFTDCDFTAARLDKVEFIRCGLVRCRFADTVKETIFDGRLFDQDECAPNIVADVDMLGAVLRLAEFRGFNLRAVKLPPDPSLRIIENYPCALVLQPVRPEITEVIVQRS